MRGWREATGFPEMLISFMLRYWWLKTRPVMSIPIYQERQTIAIILLKTLNDAEQVRRGNWQYFFIQSARKVSEKARQRIIEHELNMLLVWVNSPECYGFAEEMEIGGDQFAQKVGDIIFGRHNGASESLSHK